MITFHRQRPHPTWLLG